MTVLLTVLLILLLIAYISRDLSTHRQVVTLVQRYANVANDTVSAGGAGDVRNTDSSDNSTGSTDGNTDSSNMRSSICGSGRSSVAEGAEVENILLSIGIVSPVTRYSAGRAYHQQLARQVCDVLSCHDRLMRMGGMCTLTDLYEYK